MNELKFQFTPQLIAQCQAFATASMPTNLGAINRRGQKNPTKIKRQISDGKLGEEVVYKILSSYYPNLSQPDYAIYTKKDKSWDPDLKDPSGIKVAVKSYNISASGCDESWVFQYNDGKDYDCDKAIFKEKDSNHYIAFVSLNYSQNIGVIKAIVQAEWLHNKKLFGPMQVQQLLGNKVAVYYNKPENYTEYLLKYPKELIQLKLDDNNTI